MQALVIGVPGQDGAHLAGLLLAKGYEVFGTSRDANVSTFSNLGWRATIGMAEVVRRMAEAERVLVW